MTNPHDIVDDDDDVMMIKLQYNEFLQISGSIFINHVLPPGGKKYNQI